MYIVIIETVFKLALNWSDNRRLFVYIVSKMAVQGEEINRASTPMKLLEENLAETSEKTKQKKKAMENEQKHKSRIPLSEQLTCQNEAVSRCC